jgi:pimeloyl-ACP methyl ester carboxylesterase
VGVAANGRTWLSWRAEGAGEPLLLIMGLSGSSRPWFRLVPHLRRHCQVIVFDNRGTGDSDPVRGRLTMADMASDAVAVLDAAGHDRAHVMGVSMGGMVAQHVALDHSERVRSLILGCTTAGGPAGRPNWRLLTATALRPVLGATRTFPLLVPALYGRRTRREHPQRVREDLDVRVADATSIQTIVAQMGAIVGHDTRARLHELTGLPVTVVHGIEDALVPVQRGRELAAAIPGAKLVMIPGCGHILATEAERELPAIVLRHLERSRTVTHRRDASPGRRARRRPSAAQ